MLEARRIDQIDNAQTSPRLLVPVSRPDPALGRADLFFALEDFPLRIQLAVIRQNQMRRFADEQVAIDRNAQLHQAVDLAHRSEEHTSELQSRFGISYAVFCLKKKKT